MADEESQDELAEHICPSPVQFGRDDQDEYDPYDYFEDLSYLSDSYNDGTTNPRKATAQPQTLSTSGKRKRKELAKEQPSKRRKTDKGPITAAPGNEATSTVVWIAATKRDDDGNTSVQVATAGLSSVALLPDWKTIETTIMYNDTISIGAISSPQSAEDKEQQAILEPEIEETSEVPSAGVDVADLSSIAELLSREGMEALHELLKSKGIDPEAVQLVLQDLISGHERTFSEEEDEDEEESGEEPGEDHNSNG